MNGNDSSAYLTSSEKGGKSAGSAAGPAAGGAALSSKKKWIIMGSILAVLVIVGAVVGGVLGARAANDNTTSSSSANKGGIVNAAAADPITSQLPNGAVTTVTPTTVNPTATSSSGASSTISVTPLPRWNWAQSSYNAAAAGGSQAPMVGLALGNWLVLEQWMNEVRRLRPSPLTHASTPHTCLVSLTHCHPLSLLSYSPGSSESLHALPNEIPVVKTSALTLRILL